MLLSTRNRRLSNYHDGTKITKDENEKEGDPFEQRRYSSFVCFLHPFVFFVNFVVHLPF
jgi:hypothetical protein